MDKKQQDKLITHAWNNLKEFEQDYIPVHLLFSKPMGKFLDNYYSLAKELESIENGITPSEN